MSRLAWITAAALTAAAALAGGAPEWLHYDNGIAYQPVFRINAGDGWGVKFVPTAPGFIQQVQIYVGNPSGYSGWDGFNVEVWNWQVSPPYPGSRVWGPKAFTYDHGGWVTYATVDFHWDTTRPFVVLVTQRDSYPNCDTIYCDTSRTVPNPNLSYFNQQWSYFTLVDGDLLLRAFYGECYPGVDPASWGRVKAMYQ